MVSGFSFAVCIDLQRRNNVEVKNIDRVEVSELKCALWSGEVPSGMWWTFERVA